MTTNLLKQELDNLERFISGLNQIIFGHLNQYVEKKTHFLVEIDKSFHSLKELQNNESDFEKILQIKNQFHQQNIELVKLLDSQEIDEILTKNLLDDIELKVNQFINSVPDKIITEYTDNDLNLSLKKSYASKVYCFFEKNNISLQKGLNKSGNTVRKIFKSEKKPFKKNHFNIHYKNVLINTFFRDYFLQINEYINECEKMILTEYNSFFELEYSLIEKDYSIEKNDFKALQDINIQKFSSILNEFFKNRKQQFEEELRNSRMFFSNRSYQNLENFKYPAKSIIDNFTLWINTYFALYHDWQFRDVLFGYALDVNLNFTRIKSLFEEKINKNLLPEIEKKIAHTNFLLKCISEQENIDKTGLKKIFTKEQYEQNKNEKENIENLQKIFNLIEELPNLLNKLKIDIAENLSAFPDEVGVVKNPDYTKKIKGSEIKYYSPKELIQYEYLQNLSNSIDSLKTKIETKIENIHKEITEYDQIIDYYLDSALALTNDENSSENVILEIFNNGIKRLANKNEEISNVINTLKTDDLKRLTELLSNYITNIKTLDDNSNVYSIYIRLLSSKALKSAKENRKYLKELITKNITKLNAYINTKLEVVKLGYSNVKKQLGATATENVITSETSNYLLKVQTKINQLPVIYQHLFDNLPVKEPNLFLYRNEEIARLEKAYDNWINSNYSATLVTGENGSGKTSLINYYAEYHKTNYQIIRFDVTKSYYTEEHFFQLMNALFGQTNLKSDDELKQFYESNTTRKIIILDGVERLFLRIVNGFECLNKLLTFIVSTNEKFLWICSISKYSLEYLKKTIAINDYFDFEINLDTLDLEEVEEIILKRNRLGGYKVLYSTEVEIKNGNKTEETNQELLKQDFFKELYKFAQSNIQLSLYYWLQSINTVDDYNVEVGDFAMPDFSFLDSFSFEKIFTLYLIVIHGKITAEEHALIFNQPLYLSQKTLYILKEDSVLIATNGFFKLNGILFHSVVKLLKNKNLIH